MFFQNVGWFNWSRRLSKDYEILPETTEAFIYVAMIRLMLKQLVPFVCEATPNSLGLFLSLCSLRPLRFKNNLFKQNSGVGSQNSV